MSDTRHESYCKWYYGNRNEINRKRRERYKNDEIYRNKIKKNVKEYRLEHLDDIRGKKRQYRLRNKTRLLTISKDWQKNRVLTIFNELGNHCSICGLSDYRVFEIHHKYGKDRKSDWFKIDYDLSKLELLCANCHKIVHYKEGNHRI